LEVLRRLFIGRRDAHQAGDRELKFISAVGEEIPRRFGSDSSFLRLVANIDLNQEFGPLRLPLHFVGDGPGDLGPVDCLDAVEQGHCLRRLVALQGPDQVEFEVGPLGAKTDPFRLRFLHAVFAECALPGLDDRRDVGCTERLAHRDQGNVVRRASRRPGSFGNSAPHGRQPIVSHVVSPVVSPLIALLAGHFKDWYGQSQHSYIPPKEACIVDRTLQPPRS
jgi:hypothetical protein